jgi:alpha-beta hydrolase superfamily lysophospholipase
MEAWALGSARRIGAQVKHETGTFETTGGLTLFEQRWVADGPPRAVVAIVHGYAEHSGRYAWTAERLTASGYAVEALDLRGHGRSGGERVFVNSFDEYLDDVEGFLARVRDRNPGLPVFLFGHSMGGGVVTAFTIARRPALAGVLLSGSAMLGPRPSARPDPSNPPRPPGPLPANTISRDPAVVAAYESDPLVYRGAPRTDRAAAMGAAFDMVQQGMESIALPLLIMHGTGDLLVPFEGSRVLMERASSKDKTLKLYEGLYHEILNEPEKEQVIADIIAWLDARTSPTGG